MIGRSIPLIAAPVLATSLFAPASAQSVLGRSLEMNMQVAAKLCSSTKCNSRTVPLTGRLYISRDGTIFDYVGSASGNVLRQGDSFTQNNSSGALRGRVRNGKYYLSAHDNAVVNGRSLPVSITFIISVSGNRCHVAVTSKMPKELKFSYSTQTTYCRAHRGNIFAKQ